MWFYLVVISVLVGTSLVFVMLSAKQAKTLASFETFQELTLKHAISPILVIQSRRLLYANPSFLAFFDNIDWSGLSQYTFADLLIGEDRSSASEILADTTRPVKFFECTFRTSTLKRGEVVLTPIYYHGQAASQLVIHDITERYLQSQRVQQMAYTDPLTGLLNRTAFLASLASPIENDVPFAVLFLDLDGFKAVNDTLGHEAGDTLLRTIASRLSQCVRGRDLVCRLGGDEFTLALFGIHGSDDVIPVVTRIMASVTAPIALPEKDAHVSASIGIALSIPEDADPDSVVRRADHAMYEAKTSGANRYRFAPTLKGDID